MRILKLDYHLDRLCSSLRILFPQHSFDDLPLPQQVGLEARVGGGHFVVDAPAKDALLILFGGESRGGQCAAEELALQLTQKVPGAVVKSMAGQSPDILTRHVGACAIIREFPPTKTISTLVPPPLRISRQQRETILSPGCAPHNVEKNTIEK